MATRGKTGAKKPKVADRKKTGAEGCNPRENGRGKSVNGRLRKSGYENRGKNECANPGETGGQVGAENREEKADGRKVRVLIFTVIVNL